MSATYDYSKSPVVLRRLRYEIVEAGLDDPENLKWNEGETPDNLHVTFTEALTGPQETTLDGVVAAHDGSPGSVTIPEGLVVVRGARLRYVSATAVNVGTSGKPSHVAGLLSGEVYGWTGLLPVDTTASGAGGLAEGESISDGDWLGIYIIADSTRLNPVAALASFVANPALPDGYDWFYRVGLCRLNGSDDIVKFYQQGAGDERYYWFDVNQTSLQILDAGAATAWTEIDLSAFRPPTSFRIKLRAELYNATSANVQGMLRPHGSGVTNAVFKMRTADSKYQQVFLDDFVVGPNGNIDYVVDDADTQMSIWSCGFVDEI